MARTLYLIIFSNGKKPAHWAIWIPTDGQDDLGKKTHTTGNPATGFFLEFKRNYNRGVTTDIHQIMTLGQVQDNLIADAPTTLPETRDTTARDRLESAAITVPPPIKSANPFDPAAPNCQNWIFDYIEKLIGEGHLAEDARAVLQSAPRYI